MTRFRAAYLLESKSYVRRSEISTLIDATCFPANSKLHFDIEAEEFRRVQLWRANHGGSAYPAVPNQGGSAKSSEGQLRDLASA